jgi:hypothetical protein
MLASLSCNSKFGDLADEQIWDVGYPGHDIGSVELTPHHCARSQWRAQFPASSRRDDSFGVPVRARLGGKVGHKFYKEFGPS